MHKTVVALFDNFSTASDAVRELVDNGFNRSDVSMVASDSEGEYRTHLGTEATTSTEASGATEGASVGAGVGAVIGGLGGLLVGLGALTIPGIGPIIAAGPLAAALSGLAGAGIGAVAGGVTGGLLGALVDMGIPEETAGYYAEGIRRGGTLVTVRTDDFMAEQAVNILNRHDPVDINERATQWRESGWTGFDTSATTSDTTIDRDLSSRDLSSRDLSSHDVAVSTRGDYERSGSMPAVEGSMTDYRDFSYYDSDFRSHYDTTLAGTGSYTYDQYQPAYRYGYDLATDTRYHDYEWDRLEPEAQRYWEERNPGTWDRFKLAVRHAWEEIKDAVD